MAHKLPLLVFVGHDRGALIGKMGTMGGQLMAVMAAF